jgi:hypothetical protein
MNPAMRPLRKEIIRWPELWFIRSSFRDDQINIQKRIPLGEIEKIVRRKMTEFATQSTFKYSAFEWDLQRTVGVESTRERTLEMPIFLEDC